MRLFLLQYGAERVTKTLSLRGGSAELYWEPFIGVLVETSDGWILLDTGMGRPALDDDSVQRSYRTAAEAVGADTSAVEWHLYPAPAQLDRWNWGLPAEPMVTALKGYDLDPSDIGLAAVSHLHIDHSGGIPTLARAGVPVAIQNAELAFAMSETVGVTDGFYAPDWSEPKTVWQNLDGDGRLAPGVHAIATPGHTPGHMAFRVDLPQTGTWIFTCDATDLGQNLLDRTPCGSSVGAAGEANAERSLERLLRMAGELDARLIPGHDQVVLNAVRHPPDGHR